MFGSKTTRLLGEVDRLKHKGRKVAAFKPKMDARYSADKISSHNGGSVDAYSIERAEEIFDLSYQFENNEVSINDIKVFFESDPQQQQSQQTSSTSQNNEQAQQEIINIRERLEREDSIVEGRFPANIILDEIAGEFLDEQSGYLKSGEVKPHHKKNKTANGYQGSCYGKFQNTDTSMSGYGDGGGASRFFYKAKVSKKERNMGLDGFEEKEKTTHKSNFRCELCGYQKNSGTPCKCENPSFVEIEPNPQKNIHPTVKPVALMAYLCRLVTPQGGIVLDPFMGSGSTGISARLEGFRFCGMEMDEDYFKIAETRIENYEKYREFIKK